jgi:hypothetical protein
MKATKIAIYQLVIHGTEKNAYVQNGTWSVYYGP